MLVVEVVEESQEIYGKFHVAPRSEPGNRLKIVSFSTSSMEWSTEHERKSIYNITNRYFF